MHRLEQDEWLQIAKGLPVGQSIRIQHTGCSHRNNLVISNREDCYTAYCFSCKGKGFVRKSHVYSMEQGESSNDRKIPEDIGPLTTQVLKWLAGKGIDTIHLRGWSAGYSKSANRLIIRGNGAVLGRAIGTSHAKWLTYQSDGYCKSWDVPWTSEICIFEDVLSAAKAQWALGRGVTCVAALGTKLNWGILPHCLSADRVSVFLDNDEAGHTGTLGMIKHLKALDVPCRAIYSTYQDDVKLLTAGTIAEMYHEG